MQRQEGGEMEPFFIFEFWKTSQGVTVICYDFQLCEVLQFGEEVSKTDPEVFVSWIAKPQAGHEMGNGRERTVEQP